MGVLAAACISWRTQASPTPIVPELIRQLLSERQTAPSLATQQCSTTVRKLIPNRNHHLALPISQRESECCRPQLHRTGDTCKVNKVFRGVCFDMIHINGLLGFGIDSPKSNLDMIKGCQRTVQPKSAFSSMLFHCELLTGTNLHCQLS